MQSTHLEVELSCAAFAEAVDAVLDRAAPAEWLNHPHIQMCEPCHDLATSAKVILAGVPLPTPMNDLTERIVTAALRDHRARHHHRRQFRRGLLAMAALLLVGTLGFAFWPRDNDKIEPAFAVVTPKPSPLTNVVEPKLKPLHLTESITQAGDAIAAITRDATTPAIVSARNLPVPTGLPKWKLDDDENPSDVALMHVPNAARTSLEPVTTSTRRAFDLFMRDTSLALNMKPNS